MERLRNVLGGQSGHLARALEVHAGIEPSVARRFVQIAGADLLEAYDWQRGELNEKDLDDPCNARSLLSAAYAGRIANEMGISRSQVWAALRAFVPRVLRLADGFPASRLDVEPPSMAMVLRWTRPMVHQDMRLNPID